MKSKKTIKHKGIALENDRFVYLAKYGKGYSLAFKRPAKDSDYEETPRGGEIDNGVVTTQVCLSDKAMAALMRLYFLDKGLKSFIHDALVTTNE